MVSLENAVIARLHKGADRFEILVDPHETEHIMEGKTENILSALAIDAVFSDSKKGTHAPIESLQKHFNTTDISIIAKEIILKGRNPAYHRAASGDAGDRKRNVSSI